MPSVSNAESGITTKPSRTTHRRQNESKTTSMSQPEIGWVVTVCENPPPEVGGRAIPDAARHTTTSKTTTTEAIADGVDITIAQHNSRNHTSPAGPAK